MDLIEKINALSEEKRKRFMEKVRNDGSQYGIYPLTASQNSLWCDHIASESHNKSSNTSFRMRIVNASEERILNAVNTLFLRHDVFRYRFVEIDGVAYQYIDREAAPDIMRTELPNGSDETVEAEEKHFYNIPFDLEHGLPVITELARISDSDYVLLMCVHHVICDGYSIGVILRELYTLIGGKPLPGEKYQFAPYICEFNSKSGMMRQSENERYWIENISGVDKFAGLPADFDRRTVRTSEGGAVDIVVANDDYDRLSGFVRETKSSQYIVLATLFSVILSRWACKDSLIIASTLFNRNDDKLLSVVGDFASVVPIVFSVDESLTFEELIINNMKDFSDSMDHGDVVFNHIAEAYRSERVENAFPVYQVCMVYHSKNLIGGDPNVGGGIRIDVKDLAVEGNVSDIQGMDMLVKVTDLGDRSIVSLQYAKNLFRKKTVEKIAEIYEKLIHDLCSLRNTKIEDYVPCDMILPESRSIRAEALPEAYTPAEISVERCFIYTNGENNFCILDRKNRPVTVSFFGNVYVKVNGNWYSTGKTGRINSDNELEISEERSSVIGSGSGKKDISAALKQLNEAFPDTHFSFRLTDDARLILNCRTDASMLAYEQIESVLQFKVDLIYRISELAGKMLSDHQNSIIRAVDKLSKNGYICRVFQHENSDLADIIFSGDSAARTDLISEIRDFVRNERIRYRYSSADVSGITSEEILSLDLFDYPMRKRSVTELRMTDIWRRILGTDDFGVYDNFYDVGGDSVKVVVLMNDVSREFGISISISDLFIYNSIKELSEYIGSLMENVTHDEEETEILSF